MQIAHFGYLVAGIRKKKAYSRNRPLLMRDAQVFPTRRLGKVLLLRQLQQDADALAESGAQNDDRVQMWRAHAVRLFRAEFMDPKDQYHAIARPFYERCLRALEQGTEIECSLAGKRGGLNGERAKPGRMWVYDAQELKALLDYQSDQVVKQMTPAVVRVDPFVDEPVNTEAVPV